MIILKSDEEIDLMRESGALAASVLDMIADYIKEGVSTAELDRICHEYILDHGAIPAPLNYRGFPKSICTSVNDVVCHGIPSPKQILKPGDILNIDVTTILHGYHGDTSRMYTVEKTTSEAEQLIRVTKECLENAIAIVRAGVRLGDIGYAIQSHAHQYHYSVVREFVGHGIGKNFHEDPQILHYGEKNKGQRLEEGMVFTIEPMINQGHWKTKLKRDGWTAVTVDGKLSAQFEHTIAIRNNGEVEILTRA